MSTNKSATNHTNSLLASELIARQGLYKVINSLEFTTQALECLTTKQPQPVDEQIDAEGVTTQGLCHLLKGICQAAEEDYARSCAEYSLANRQS